MSCWLAPAWRRRPKRCSRRRRQACCHPGSRSTWPTRNGWWSAIPSTPSTYCRWSRCARERSTAPAAVDRAVEVYSSLGMSPLRLRREIDGFIADRLLEALWREALWLVADDVATVSEVDDALRLGPGLRWSFMGSFMSYRLGGGELGMRHFLDQFGPTLKWPWTKLTDVPELTEELTERIVAESDAQAAGRSARELERHRDDCLVAVLQALRSEGTGAGAVLREWELRLVERAGRTGSAAEANGLLVHRAGGASGVGGLQRPRPREPPPPGVRGRDRRAAGGHRDRRWSTSRRGAATTRSRRICRSVERRWSGSGCG